MNAHWRRLFFLAPFLFIVLTECFSLNSVRITSAWGMSVVSAMRNGADGICKEGFDYVTASSTSTRRSLLSDVSFGLAALIPLSPSFAAIADDIEISLLQGVVSLQPGVEPVSGQPNIALYVTVRPDRPDNVPAAILSGTRGKPPPVLTAKFLDPKFPFEFNLAQKDLTVEGISGAGDGNLDLRKLWWLNDNLVVSARLDSDGVAATRDPSDLVGRGFRRGNSGKVEVQLQGRGIAGKFATSKAQ